MFSHVDLLELVQLEKVGPNEFKGQNYKTSWGRVFGGQLLSQSLFAAYQTVANPRIAHSMHGYFVRGGSIDLPIIFKVHVLRDSTNFSYRSIFAYQNELPIFVCAISFQIPEPGAEHHKEKPSVLTPDILLSDLQQAQPLEKVHPRRYSRLMKMHPHVFEFKPVGKALLLETKNSIPKAHVWFRLKEKTADDHILNQLFLAFVSDYHLLLTATLPHRETLRVFRTFYASIDHTIWFHRSFQIDQWLLYDMESPSASNSRGFVQGSIFSKEGKLVASVAQEGLIRKYNPRISD